MAIPGVRSVVDAAKNISGAWSSGFNIASGIGAANLPFRAGSIGGLATLGGGTLAGAAVGGTVGSAHGETGTGAAIGAAVGTAALPVAGALGAGGIAAGAALVNSSGAIGGALLSGAGAVGGFAARTINPGTNPLLSRQIGLMDKIARFEPGKVVLDRKRDRLVQQRGQTKLTGLGKTLLWGAVGIGAVRGAVERSDSIRMGERDPYVTRATPRIPAYADNAGASGDLVFALNANRRG